ncbi:hypothetical protein [Lysobacter brunescens]|uniref:Uncharacterized protein n=1 Tax=Lysobacter brunescens TaxID=262323 RepID=A0ABW2YE91_9GAMM
MSTPSATVTATDTASKTLKVKITGRDSSGNLTYTTSPTSIEFHSKRASRVLKCRIDEDSIPGDFVFVGYTYDAPDVQVKDKGLDSDKLDLTFQFNGQKISADLIFEITDECGAKGRPSDVDPQVGNNPDPDLLALATASIIKVDSATNAVVNGPSANITTTLTVRTNGDGSFRGYSYTNLNADGAFEFPKGTTDDTLTVNLVVDRSQYAWRYYISEYASSVVQPVPTPEPGESGGFGEGTTSVVFAFTFDTTSANQTYFTVYVCDIGTDPHTIHDCDPQVGNNPDPD